MTKPEKEKLIELFSTMVRARAFDEKAMELFTQGSIPGFIHVGIGQEAIAAGVSLNLRPQMLSSSPIGDTPNLWPRELI